MRLPPPAPPHPVLLALEGARAMFEWGSLALSWPFIGAAARGDGHPVLVLPGLVANDATTWPLRKFLERQNFDVHPWGLGMNLGPRDGMVEKVSALVQRLAERQGRKISLVGWSLGGVIARVLGSRLPDHVRNVVTLGSPHHGDPKASHAWRVFEGVSGFRVDDPQLQELLTHAPRMPMTSLLSKSDGVVNWQLSLLPDSPLTENIEVLASHIGMGANPAVLWALADRLAQPEGQWAPLARDGWKLMFYGRPRRLADPAPAAPAAAAEAPLRAAAARIPAARRKLGPRSPRGS